MNLIYKSDRFTTLLSAHLKNREFSHRVQILKNLVNRDFSFLMKERRLNQDINQIQNILITIPVGNLHEDAQPQFDQRFR